jgi:hypothetical protein
MQREVQLDAQLSDVSTIFKWYRHGFCVTKLFDHHIAITGSKKLDITSFGWSSMA